MCKYDILYLTISTPNIVIREFVYVEFIKLGIVYGKMNISLRSDQTMRNNIQFHGNRKLYEFGVSALEIKEHECCSI